MKLNFFLLLAVLVFSRCNSENKSGAKNSDDRTNKDSVKEPVIESKFEFSILPENSSPIPFSIETEKRNIRDVEFKQNADLTISLIIHYIGSSMDSISFDAKELIAGISPITFNSNYHQQLSVYLFEKQWHVNTIPTNEASEFKNYYEIVNPPHSEYWHLNLIQENDGKQIIASCAFKIPDKLYADLFKKVNNRDLAEFKNSLFNAPETKKIEYNSLRKMGKFYEGVLAPLKWKLLNFAGCFP
jgi:hypothetical protein